MEQRLLRLGDIVDDYCPRERRITNHAIVAIVEDAIRQTRCTTCDHEHVFKQGREPRRKKKDVDTLYDQVLADLTGSQLVAGKAGTGDEEPLDAATPQAEADTTPATPDAAAVTPPDDGWPAHRTLIRASLPKIDGELPPPRPIPEFTMHQKPPAPRGRGGFRFNRPANTEVFTYPRDGRGLPGGGRAPRDGNVAGNGNGNSAGSGNGRAQGRSGRRRGGKRSH
jgi:hypothetical protein